MFGYVKKEQVIAAIVEESRKCLREKVQYEETARFCKDELFSEYCLKKADEYKTKHDECEKLRSKIRGL